MAQDYKLVQFKPSDFKDQHGNTWCDVAFEGISEPVKWVVKDPSKPKVGETYYGRIEQKTSKADKPYQRFYAEKKEETTKPTEEYWADKNDAIKAQFAIKVAVQATELKASDEGYFDDIEHLAKKFFNMVEKVKGEPTSKEAIVTEEDVDKTIDLKDIPY